MRISPTMIVLALCCAIAPAQEKAPKTSGEKPAATAKSPEMTADQIKKLADALHEYLNTPEFDRKYERAVKGWQEALEEVGKAHRQEEPPANGDGNGILPAPGRSLMHMVDSWAAVLRQSAIPTKDRSVRGKGRPDSLRVEKLDKGKPVGYEYELYIPKGYDREVAWPIIVSLPPLDVDSKRYFKEVWEDRDIPRELRDKYIILVPTMGRKTRPKNSREVMTITGFDKYRLWNLYWPLVDVLSTYHVDTNRMYLEGAGEGGDLALKFAATRAKDFAGVVVRNAKPSWPDLLVNATGMPIRFIARQGETFTTEADQALRKQLEAMAKDGGPRVEVVEHEPVSDNGMKAIIRKLDVDMVPEATKSILETIDSWKRNAYPAKVGFEMRDHLFRWGPWFRVTPSEIDVDKKVIPRLKVEIDRETNTINVTQEFVDEIHFYLNDKLVDLDRIVKVVVNGQVLVEEKGERSLDTLLNYYRNNMLDPDTVVTHEIQVKIPPPPEEIPAKDGEKPAGEKGEEKSKEEDK